MQIRPEDAKEFLDSHDCFSLIKAPTKYIAGYTTNYGLHLALTLTGNKVVIYIEPHLSFFFDESEIPKIERYPAGKSRNSNISSNAPRLALGNPVLKLTVSTIKQLKAICDDYICGVPDKGGEMKPEESTDEKYENDVNAPLNQIIYGPPGTGKTYSTTAEAVKIAEPEWFYKAKREVLGQVQFRSALKKKYDELIEQGRIAFTTFHQSFSYEDFVEGIRATTDEESDTISYEIEDGIFKQLCTIASVEVQKEAGGTVNLEGRKIWKMSLGDTQGNEDHIYEECLDNNYVLLGWGQDIDFSGCNTRREIKVKLEDHFGKEIDKNNYEITSVNQFKNEIKNGDLIVVSDGNHKFRAIAKVTGEYEFLSLDSRVGFQQLRKVKWLRQYTPSLPKERLFKKSLSQMTLYQLRPATIDMVKLSGLLSQSEAKNEENRNHVLIIDEINRGNLSRIFGELITLIEEDKRKGGEDQRTVTLPYSKKPFTVPSNLYILGTMNTADKSLAQVDLALRRRFEFVELLPKPELLADVTVFGIKVSDILDVINQRIEVLLDRDHMIGHSHFFTLKKLDKQAEREEKIGAIFKKRIIPLLQEYFFSDWERISWVLNDIDKPSKAQFIQLDDIKLPVNSLFSSSVADELNDRRYRINDSAFSNPDAYLGILPSTELSQP
jgi:5-methylcytosine-specific restriction protein B